VNGLPAVEFRRPLLEIKQVLLRVLRSAETSFQFPG
jgi:hypothetical protein